MLEKVPVELGGLPDQVIGDAGKTAVADGSGGVTWDTVVATLPPITAEDVSFDNSVAELPGAPATAQLAVEQLATNRIASKIVKFGTSTGSSGYQYPGVFAIREDGVALHIGDKHTPDFGSIFQAAWDSPSNGFGVPASVTIPVFGSKVHDAVVGRWGVMVLSGTEDAPRSKIWCSGREMGLGTSQVTPLELAFTASTTEQRVAQIVTTNFSSSYTNHFYLRDDGKLFGAGHISHGQLGTGVAVSDTRQYTFSQLEGGTVTYTGGQKVTRVMASGLSTFVETTSDDVTYYLHAAGYNLSGELGVNFTGASPSNGRNAVLSFTQCKKADPSVSNIESTGPFLKIVHTIDDPDYRGCTLVLTAAGSLYQTGRILGVGSNRNIFTLIDTGVVDVAATGGTDGSFIWIKSDGVVKGAGYNVNGCLGTGNETDFNPASPATVGSFGPALKAVQAFGSYGSAFHQFFIRVEDGSVYAAGSNRNGSAGVSTNAIVLTWTKVILPEPIAEDGVYHVADPGTTYFLGESGTLYSVGHNQGTALGFPRGEIAFIAVPVQVPIPVGQYHAGYWDFLNV